jgi:hypothetical protein
MSQNNIHTLGLSEFNKFQNNIHTLGLSESERRQVKLGLSGEEIISNSALEISIESRIWAHYHLFNLLKRKT